MDKTKTSTRDNKIYRENNDERASINESPVQLETEMRYIRVIKPARASLDYKRME